LVEHVTENHGVDGSIPPLATKIISKNEKFVTSRPSPMRSASGRLVPPVWRPQSLDPGKARWSDEPFPRNLRHMHFDLRAAVNRFAVTFELRKDRPVVVGFEAHQLRITALDFLANGFWRQRLW
jgi:hypothetical protein